MKVDQVLRMNEGMGDASYAKNSLLQQRAISLAKPIIEEAVTSLYCNTLPRSLAIADLGCSSGPNTFLALSQIIKSMEKLCRELNQPSPEYQVFMNDLPGNDFNSIFKSLGSFKKKLRNEMGTKVGPCYITGVPGSFYDRIFPAKSLHFVHSSYSLHWLSQVPKGIENNKGNIYISKRSPRNVLDGYYQQFERDFSMFLKCRAEELVEGGCMVLTCLGRRSDDPASKESVAYIYELLATALNHLASKGLIEAEEVDNFNIPNYTPSPSELKREILKEGSFSIKRMEVFAVPWNYCGGEATYPIPKQCGGGSAYSYDVAKCMRAVLEPVLLDHFDQPIVDEAFRLYHQLIADSMSSKAKTEFTNVTIYLTARP